MPRVSRLFYSTAVTGALVSGMYCYGLCCAIDSCVCWKTIYNFIGYVR
jgi:hypothetical protein